MSSIENKKIPEGWMETTLGEVVDFVVDNRGKTPPIMANGFELLEVNAVSENRREPDYSKVSKFVDEATFENWFRKGTVKKGDVLVPTVGTIGNASYSKQDRGAIAQNLIALRTNKDSDSQFLYYFLTNPKTKTVLLNLDIGGVQPSIKVPHLLNMSVCFPSLPEQQAIARILSSLDDKIELLREQNETLEKTAQVIFQEWFGRYRVESELPEGWKVGKLSDILKLLYGKALKSEDRENLGYPVIGSSGIVGYHNQFLVVWPWIVVGRKWNMGSILWIEKSFYPIDTTFYVEDLLWIESLEYHLLLLNSLDFSKIGSDSAVPWLSRDAAYSVEVTIPKNETINEFIRIVKPIFEKKSHNNRQIQLLSKTRDELLPRLMSGEVRVEI